MLEAFVEIWSIGEKQCDCVHHSVDCSRRLRHFMRMPVSQLAGISKHQHACLVIRRVRTVNNHKSENILRSGRKYAQRDFSPIY